MNVTTIVDHIVILFDCVWRRASWHSTFHSIEPPHTAIGCADNGTVFLSNGGTDCQGIGSDPGFNGIPRTYLAQDKASLQPLVLWSHNDGIIG
ncbi:hypothetical protein L218DRAFT_963370 [Marasmius fiardii PR-910]|nr:hypothetical protein L218DRAFT_963370 [Marasmius fiardii PR-910]